MSLAEGDAEKLIALLSRTWDGVLTEADQKEIDGFIASRGKQGAEVLLRICVMHLELHRRVASTKLYEQVMSAVVEQGGVAGADAVPAKAQGTALDRGGFVPLGGVMSAPGVHHVAVAALLLIAAVLGYYTWNAPSRSVGEASVALGEKAQKLVRPSKPIASLVSVSNAVWKGAGRRVGQTVSENERLELTAGSAQLSMACGADLVLQAPCSVTLVSNDTARLENGKLTAQAAEWATGFSVVANDLKVVDLGTRFAVSADLDGVAEAHVLEGSVLAETLKEQQLRQSSVLLKTGEAIRVDGRQATVNLMAARASDFVDALDAFLPLRPVPMWNTGVGPALGSEDSHWRVTSGSSEFGPYPRQAIITEGATGLYRDNRPEVSQWISVARESYPGVPPKSMHTFETTFDLSGFDVETVHIVGYFLVDDAINDLRINGNSVDFERWATTWDVFDFQSFHPIEIKEHFVSGTNVISIDVFNSPSRPDQPGPNPTALRVEWQAFGRPAGSTL